ncbi:hypothetical protein [Daejeonella lutea]|uniref:Uncharacterized protein n=1 Tax=Daejeonella lutea TaxID=572036 RepID=A0A1T5CTB4_9SPHI|nr:hypothetical protein [Daejeonella lutea]SKB62561.1 hypothetical protein SAMN05661099_1841 [Daejeonella lutea]
MDIKDLLNPEESSGEAKKESPLKSLEGDLKFYNESLKEVAVEIMAEGISSYPIFVAHQHEVKLGEVILDKNDLNTEWSIHASTLEEFMEKGLILPEKQEKFLKQYKDAYHFMCVFVIVPEGANFVFFPYQ